MSYIIEVLTRERDEKEPSWKAVRPSHSKEPYRYQTEEEAEWLRRMCYGTLFENDTRVRKEDT